MTKYLLLAVGALLIIGCSEGFKTPKKMNLINAGQTTSGTTGGTSGGTTGGTSGGTTSGGTTSGGSTGGTSGGTTSGGTTTGGGGCQIVSGPSSAPACTNGRMENYKDYFFYLINRAEGSCADDWQDVMNRLPIGSNPAPGQILGDGSPYYGLTQQRNSGGEVRGRLFLPTDVPDEYNYYVHNVDVLREENGHFYWQWYDRGGNPVAPRSCN